MWCVSINNRLWVKFSENRCDFLIKDRTEVVRKFRFRNVTGENGTFALSKQLISKPIQLYLELHFDRFSQKWLRLAERITRFFTFLCSVKIYLWTVRPLERHRLSALRRLHLAAFTSSVIHGADERAVTVRVTSGACRSRAFLSDAFNSSNSSQSGHSASDEATWETSVWNLVGSIRRRFRDVTCCFTRPGFLRERLQKTVLWSDSAVSTSRRLMMIESSRTITQPRVWPQRWVGWPTNCCKQQLFTNDLNLHTSLSCWLSLWKWKSPVTITSPFLSLGGWRKSKNSSKNILFVLLFCLL